MTVDRRVDSCKREEEEEVARSRAFSNAVSH